MILYHLRITKDRLADLWSGIEDFEDRTGKYVKFSNMESKHADWEYESANIDDSYCTSSYEDIARAESSTWVSKTLDTEIVAFNCHVTYPSDQTKARPDSIERRLDTSL